MIAAILVLSPAAHADQTTDRFEKLVARPDYRTALLSSALLQRGLLEQGCFGGGFKIQVYNGHPHDVRFVESRIWPVSGYWSARLIFRPHECGSRFAANVTIFAHPQSTPLMVSTVPGTSNASYGLKRSIRDQVVAFARQATDREGCPHHRFANSHNSEVSTSDSGATTLLEIWTVRVCDRETDIRIEVKADPSTSSTGARLQSVTDPSTGLFFRESTTRQPIYDDDGRIRTLAETALSDAPAAVEEALTALRFLAAENVTEAQYRLAASLADRPGEDRFHLLEALYWSARATANGSAEAAHLAGQILEAGPYRAPPDLRASAVLYRQAEILGAPHAAADLKRLMSVHPWLDETLETHPAF